MTAAPDFEIFLVTAPGLETALAAEACEKRFRDPRIIKGGVTVQGGWPEVWRANLELRGAARVLARIAEFRAMHVAQLDKRSRKVAWGEILRADQPFWVEASCKASRIYHQGAAAQRVTKAIQGTLGASASEDAEVVIKARIDDDLCTISVDTSGESLHKRGHKEAVAKAPMRENLAALFLRQCGFDGKEPVVDPMCGSGTFVIEAAEIAAGLQPGRSRRFAFEQLKTFDSVAWNRMRAGKPAALPDGIKFHGSDRDAGAVAMSRANAERAGVASLTAFKQQAISDLTPPEGKPGLVIANPPYGARIGDRKQLTALYRALGQTLLAKFSGWRVGIITNETPLAEATGLPFLPPGDPVSHGGIRVRLFQTQPLP
ncbi:class I SAM-dependent RNA methyltransferase [Dongia sp.]|uniref:THUMP domain-containing class I SAM-dependent RNA methyltransferase n=1 Tax=Dongia sp. TaxID=1977262 RepID=UPI003751A426